ncbi:hypothetical protein SAMN04487895_105229 [Paenibacillus sophorae]|uniref:Uncharacterized protein n=1 Tax=Paenibacillus sophorae TaxID=1333845 RepID=A0A1H8MHI1_9BACL|nr:hypothetical protein [Paenibacillus sophorae]QWU17811.1 hypothetical protein KP014_12120 [Paenibacillus sophorae]SEO16626.1 hypothetical protein SAMN04487895_105229 [Paenibacillus sophorae]
MSFVSVLGRRDFLCVMSDGTLIGDNNEILQEDYQRFINIGNQAFIAFAGSQGPCEELSVQMLPYFDVKTDFSAINNALTDFFNTDDLNQREVKVMIAFGGINLDGNIEFFTVDSETNKSERYFPEGEDIKFCFLRSGDTLTDLNVKGKMIELLRTTGANTPTECVSAQKLLNDYIADHDAEVNKKTSRMVIKK